MIQLLAVRVVEEKGQIRECQRPCCEACWVFLGAKEEKKGSFKEKGMAIQYIWKHHLRNLRTKKCRKRKIRLSDFSKSDQWIVQKQYEFTSAKEVTREVFRRKLENTKRPSYSLEFASSSWVWSLVLSWLTRPRRIRNVLQSFRARCKSTCRASTQWGDADWPVGVTPSTGVSGNWGVSFVGAQRFWCYREYTHTKGLNDEKSRAMLISKQF